METIEKAPPETLAQEIAEADRTLRHAPAEEIARWALDRFGDALTLTASFQDVVLVDLARQLRPDVEVVFLDTGAHFDETLGFVRLVAERFSLRLTILGPGDGAAAWPCGSERCCQVRKVEPLRRHLSGRQAWMTGLRRVETPARAGAPVVGFDSAFGVVKVNPLATWDDEQVAAYVARRTLPVHPLVRRGYLSIGCAPTTRAVAVGEDPRAGRWAGNAKTECGLHG